MQIDWKLEIKDPNGAVAPDTVMNEIYAYVQPTDSDQIYACGYRWDRPLLETTRTATIMQMSKDGIITVLYNFGEAVTTGSGGTQKDVCRSVAFDYGNIEVAFMLESTSESLRPDYRNYNQWSGKNNDMTVILMQPGG